MSELTPESPECENRDELKKIMSETQSELATILNNENTNYDDDTNAKIHELENKFDAAEKKLALFESECTKPNAVGGKRKRTAKNSRSKKQKKQNKKQQRKTRRQNKKTHWK